MQVVRAHFRPEFLNRLDDIILFHRLKRSEMGAIVDIQLKRLQKLLDDRKITLDLDESARNWLAAKGYDPVYGARPLKRVIQREVQDPLAEKILARRDPGRLEGEGHRRHRQAPLPAARRRRQGEGQGQGEGGVGAVRASRLAAAGGEHPRVKPEGRLSA